MNHDGLVYELLLVLLGVVFSHRPGVGDVINRNRVVDIILQFFEILMTHVTDFALGHPLARSGRACGIVATSLWLEVRIYGLLPFLECKRLYVGVLALEVTPKGLLVLLADTLAAVAHFLVELRGHFWR